MTTDPESRHWQHGERLPGGAECVASINVRRVFEAARLRERARRSVVARLWEWARGMGHEAAMDLSELLEMGARDGKADR